MTPCSSLNPTLTAALCRNRSAFCPCSTRSQAIRGLSTSRGSAHAPSPNASATRAEQLPRKNEIWHQTSSRHGSYALCLRLLGIYNFVYYSKNRESKTELSS